MNTDDEAIVMRSKWIWKHSLCHRNFAEGWDSIILWLSYSILQAR